MDGRIFYSKRCCFIGQAAVLCALALGLSLSGFFTCDAALGQSDASFYYKSVLLGALKFQAFLSFLTGVICALISFQGLFSKERNCAQEAEKPGLSGAQFVRFYLKGIFMFLIIYGVAAAAITAEIEVLHLEGPASAVLWRNFSEGLAVTWGTFSVVALAAAIAGGFRQLLWLTGILFLQIPATAAILYLFVYYSFWTFCDLDGWQRLFLTGLSPAVIYYIHMIDLLNQPAVELNFCMIFIILAVVSSLAAFAAYRYSFGAILRRTMIRGSMVQAVKTAAVVITFMGCFLYIGQETQYMGEGKTLLILFGPAIGAHILLEIFHHGIRFKKRHICFKSFLCSLLLAVLITAGFWFDWLGFDRLPSKDRVVSYAIEIPQLDRWIYYGGRDGRYVLENMEAKNIDGLYRLLQSEELLELFHRMNGSAVKWYNYGMDGMFVRYHLNNGRSITRFYYFNILEKKSSFYREQMYSDSDVKAGIYPILSAHGEDITGIDCETYEGKVKLVLTEKERTELLALYQQELEELTYEECTEEAPVASLSFYGDDPECFLEPEEAWYPSWLSQTGIETDFYHRSREYPVYLSFQRVQDFLEKRGYFFGELDLSKIETVVLDKGNSFESLRKYTGDPAAVTDSDLIREIMKKPVYPVYQWGVSYKYQIGEYLEATVKLKEEHGDGTYQFEIDPKQVPEEIMGILINYSLMY